MNLSFAAQALDEAFGSLDALSHELEGSRLASYRATLQLRACHANSKVKRHEVAFDACDGAVARVERDLVALHLGVGVAGPELERRAVAREPRPLELVAQRVEAPERLVERLGGKREIQRRFNVSVRARAFRRKASTL